MKSVWPDAGEAGPHTGDLYHECHVFLARVLGEVFGADEGIPSRAQKAGNQAVGLRHLAGQDAEGEEGRFSSGRGVADSKSKI